MGGGGLDAVGQLPVQQEEKDAKKYSCYDSSKSFCCKHSINLSSYVFDFRDKDSDTGKFVFSRLEIYRNGIG
jgi:hypothetical protein